MLDATARGLSHNANPDGTDRIVKPLVRALPTQVMNLSRIAGAADDESFARAHTGRLRWQPSAAFRDARVGDPARKTWGQARD